MWYRISDVPGIVFVEEKSPINSFIINGFNVKQGESMIKLMLDNGFNERNIAYIYCTDHQNVHSCKSGYKKIKNKYNKSINVNNKKLF